MGRMAGLSLASATRGMGDFGPATFGVSDDSSENVDTGGGGGFAAMLGGYGESIASSGSSSSSSSSGGSSGGGFWDSVGSFFGSQAAKTASAAADYGRQQLFGSQPNPALHLPPAPSKFPSWVIPVGVGAVVLLLLFRGRRAA